MLTCISFPLGPSALPDEQLPKHCSSEFISDSLMSHLLFKLISFSGCLHDFYQECVEKALDRCFMICLHQRLASKSVAECKILPILFCLLKNVRTQLSIAKMENTTLMLHLDLG